MKRLFSIFFLIAMSLAMFALTVSASNNNVSWGEYALVNNMPTFTDAGKDIRGNSPGSWGSEFGRMTKLTNGNWAAVYSIYDNNGYEVDPDGGTRLQVSISEDNCQTWEVAYTISEPGRDLDNGQIIQLNNGDLLICCRSVIWQESYKLNVYRSDDEGTTWTYLSTIDQNEGTAESMSNPDKGVYEPYMGILDTGEIAVFYSSEKHVTEDIAYAQTVSEKISTDNGATWGEEIFVAWDPEYTHAKPGMPVFTQMSDGRYIVVFEDGYHDDYNVHYKISEDGRTWDVGLGKAIPDQLGAPYITRLSNGRLMLISNSLNVSFSDDNAATWTTNNPAPWTGTFPDYCWASCYEIAPNTIAVMGSAPRAESGHNVKIRFGTMDLSSITMPYFNDFNYGNDYGFTKYGGEWKIDNNAYNSAHETGKALVGDTTWQNYCVEVDITPKENNINAGIVFRATNPGVGADEMQGYFAGIDNNGVVLGKMNNAWTSLRHFQTTILTGETYHLKVVAQGSKIEIYLNHSEIPAISVTDSSFYAGQVGLRVCDSKTTFDNLSIQECCNYLFQENFNDGNDNGWDQYSGTWNVENGTYHISSGIGKSLSGSENWHNYTVEADIKPADTIINTGLVVRATNPGYGADELQGYFIGLNCDGVVIGRMNNNWRTLSTARKPISRNVWYHIKIEVQESSIKVYLDNMHTPLLVAKDSSFGYGKIGVRAYECATYFDNIVVY